MPCMKILLLQKRRLVASVSRSYYNLYALNEKQVVLAQNIQLLKTHEALALSAVEVGKASAVDILRIQMRQNELEQIEAGFRARLFSGTHQL